MHTDKNVNKIKVKGEYALCRGNYICVGFQHSNKQGFHRFMFS